MKHVLLGRRTLAVAAILGPTLRSAGAKLKGTIDIKPAGTWMLGVDLKGPLTLIDGAGKEKGTAI
jgi:hypothetical protein